MTNINLNTHPIPNLKPANAGAKKSASSSSADSSKKFSDVLSDKNVQPKDIERQNPETRAESQADIQSKKKSPDQLQNQASSVQDEKNRVKPVTREAAMSVFLDKMNKELGVDSAEVVEAFASLSASDLLAPPEESANQVLSNLGLTGEDKEKALGLYQDMLAMTAAAGMSSYLDKSGSTANMQVMTVEQQRQHRMGAGIDSMNASFFAPQSNAVLEPKTINAGQSLNANSSNFGAQQTVADIGSVAGTETVESIGQQQTSNGIISEREVLFSKNEFFPSVTTRTKAEPAPVSTLDQLQMQQIKSAQTETVNGDNQQMPLAFIDSSLQTSAEMTESPDVLLQQLKQELQPLQAHIDGITESSAAPMPLVAASSDWSSQDEEMSDSGEFTSDLAGLQSSDLQANKTMTAKSPFAVGLQQATEADVKENVKEIINQAQFLAKKGGGEMKVILSPEGIGELNLKVKMSEGQVNVEMITSSDEAKKLLEKGLGELKESLASHKLHLDSVKIENTKDISNQLMDQRQDLERSFQQKFLNDFRQNNHARSEFFAQPTPRVPGSQTADQATNSSYDASKKRRDLSRRLDLVA